MRERGLQTILPVNKNTSKRKILKLYLLVKKEGVHGRGAKPNESI